MMTRIGVYPGTFDPLTFGHLDIIRRGAKLVDRLVVGVTTNASKSPMFTVEERLAMVRREVQALEGGLTADGLRSTRGRIDHCARFTRGRRFRI